MLVPPSPRAGSWRDYETGESGGVLALIARCLGGTQADAAGWLEEADLTQRRPDHFPARPLLQQKEYRTLPCGRGRFGSVPSRYPSALNTRPAVG